jgi:formate dehydrogenase subunit gamma
MTATPGSARPMASEAPAAAVVRFGPTERTLHWVHAGAFGVMLGTGLVLYLPALAQVIANRPLMKAAHLVAAVAWLTALALVALLGDRGALRRTRRDLERFTDDDLRWLRRAHPTPPAGRFNAGQKAHAVVQAALAVLFTISGALLWLGERNTRFRLPGTIALHDAAMYAGTLLVLGHVYMALDTRGSMQGILRGTVPAGYAAEHHPRWVAGAPDADGARRPGAVRLLAALAILMLGAFCAALLAHDSLG